MLSPKQRKQPRHHEGLNWESQVLTNEFVDITRMALDDKYAKQAAPLSKRRDGIGFTSGNESGIFGIVQDTTDLYRSSFTFALATWSLIGVAIYQLLK